jgi:hypothetical protein
MGLYSYTLHCTTQKMVGAKPIAVLLQNQRELAQWKRPPRVSG